MYPKTDILKINDIGTSISEIASLDDLPSSIKCCKCIIVSLGHTEKPLLVIGSEFVSNNYFHDDIYYAVCNQYPHARLLIKGGGKLSLIDGVFSIYDKSALYGKMNDCDISFFLKILNNSN